MLTQIDLSYHRSVSTAVPHPLSSALALSLLLLCIPGSVRAEDSGPLLGHGGPERDDPTEQEHSDTSLLIFPWLSLSGQIEAEWTRREQHYVSGSNRDRNNESPRVTQLEILAQPWEQSGMTLLLEYDSEVDQLKADEASVFFTPRPWEFRAGKFYTPLGSYQSDFINDALLEFGKTRATGLRIGYTATEQSGFALMLYQGEAEQSAPHASAWDWALALNSYLREDIVMGLSYQSDLADSDARLLSDSGDRYSRRVDALSGYLHWYTDALEVRFEALGALGAFAELEPKMDRPLAWNLELAHPLAQQLKLTWRLEGSRELEDGPKLQAGLSLNWQPTDFTLITLEYLHGRFKEGLALDDNDQPFRRIDTLSARLTIGF
ncbi:MAG: hypothetical protein KDI83_18795 [Gammaproteobacteria bacterium]|nr:hypothetical protein [Gammaproteobacteria bacterium]